MTDLRSRFREADRLPAPDLWHDIVTREPREPVRPPLWPRVAVAAAAFALAALGLILLVRAFLPRTDPGESPTPTPTGAFRPEPRANGLIAFVRTDPESVLGEGGVPRVALYTVEPEGGEARRLMEGGALFRTSVAWSPDGSRIAVPGNEGVEVLDVDGGNTTRITACESPSCDFDYLPAWSPDGERLAFSRIAQESSLWTVQADGSDPRVLNDQIRTINAVAWSPDGLEIAVMGYVGPTPEAAPLSIHIVDAQTGELLREIPPPEGLDLLVTLSWSPDGRWFAFDAYAPGSSHGQGVYVMRADGTGAARLLTACPADAPGFCADQNPAWSPDGTQIAFTRVLPEAGSDGFMGDIFVIDADGGEPTRVTGGPGLDCCPAWQPIPTG